MEEREALRDRDRDRDRVGGVGSAGRPRGWEAAGRTENTEEAEGKSEKKGTLGPRAFVFFVTLEELTDGGGNGVRFRAKGSQPPGAPCAQRLCSHACQAFREQHPPPKAQPTRVPPRPHPPSSCTGALDSFAFSFFF